MNEIWAKDVSLPEGNEKWIVLRKLFQKFFFVYAQMGSFPRAINFAGSKFFWNIGSELFQKTEANFVLERRVKWFMIRYSYKPFNKISQVSFKLITWTISFQFINRLTSRQRSKYAESNFNVIDKSATATRLTDSIREHCK